jgi:hypothetical protein
MIGSKKIIDPFQRDKCEDNSLDTPPEVEEDEHLYQVAINIGGTGDSFPLNPNYGSPKCLQFEYCSDDEEQKHEEKLGSQKGKKNRLPPNPHSSSRSLNGTSFVSGSAASTASVSSKAVSNNTQGLSKGTSTGPPPPPTGGSGGGGGGGGGGSRAANLGPISAVPIAGPTIHTRDVTINLNDGLKDSDNDETAIAAAAAAAAAVVVTAEEEDLQLGSSLLEVQEYAKVKKIMHVHSFDILHALPCFGMTLML